MLICMVTVAVTRGFAQSTFIAIMPMCVRYTRKENASVKRHYLAFVVNLAAYHPRAMLGGEIESYQTETIPIFLHQLSKLFPEQYSAFIKAFPDYELKAPDYRGKYAKLSTCNRELIYRDAHGNSFRFDGDELVCDKYRIGGFMPFSSSGYAQMRIPVTDDMRVKITDSNQVTDQTVLM